MSASNDAMTAMLAQSLMRPQQSSSYGGGMLGPQMQAQATPLGTAGDLVQKLMLMRALQKQPAAPGTPALQPQPNALGAVNAIPQQMNQQTIPGGTNA